MAAQAYTNEFNIVNLMAQDEQGQPGPLRVLAFEGPDEEEAPEIGVIQAYAADQDKPGTTLVFVIFNGGLQKYGRLNLSFEEFDRLINEDGCLDMTDIGWEDVKITPRNKHFGELVGMARRELSQISAFLHAAPAGVN